MLRLLAASDSHGCCCVDSFALMAKNCDQTVFLGDVLGDAARIEEVAGADILKVAGNCDCFSRAAREIVITLEGVKLLLTHGDQWGVKYGLDRLAYRAQEAGADAALFGHTHRAFCGYVGGVLLVNPGALNERRYAEIRLDDGKAIPKLMTL